MHREIDQANEPGKGTDVSEFHSGHVPLLGEMPTKWILTIAQLYVVDTFIYLRWVRFFLSEQGALTFSGLVQFWSRATTEYNF